jgi:hypothetical protein
MEFCIQVLKQKKEEVIEKYKDETDYVKIMACKMMCDDLDKAVKTLEYEHYWKDLDEKQICQRLKLSK